MRILVVGEKLEHSLFEIVKISRMFNCNTLFFKKNVGTSINSDDVIVIDGNLIGILASDLKNLVVSVISSVNYRTSLKNEVSINLQSIRYLEEIIKNRISHRFTPVIEDPATKAAFEIADKIAPTDATVLIVGETGVGKEIMAKYIHQKSKRSSKNYVTINC
ncbi:MAG: sigma 54-interacting transcriptional regulator, partial [Holosporaceae bacterium]|nr:sigma 54-interacting transcriptional regulator [Holosporaceae bacterium]